MKEDLITRLEKNISRNNPTFEELSGIDQAIALKLIQEDKGFLIKDLPKLIYDQTPIPIEDFLTTRYVGMTAATLFPVWRKELVETVFGPHSRISELVLTGGTGTGKTTVAFLVLWYNIYRVLCFKQPQFIFGVAPSTVLANLMITINLNKADTALFRPFAELLRVSKLFTEVRTEREFADYMPLTNQIPFHIGETSMGRPSGKTGLITFPKNLITFAGSQESHAISMSLMGAMLDEVEYRRSADSIAEAMGLYETIKEREENRFLDIPWTMLILLSSARSSEGVIPKYVESIPDDSKTSKVYSFAVWEVRQFDVYNKGYFYVLKGNKVVPSRLLSDEEKKVHEAGKFELPRNCKIVKVPEAHKDTFMRNVDRALRNTAGEMSVDELFIFDAYEPFEQYSHSLPSELYMKADFTQDQILINQIPTEHLSVFSEGSKFLKRAPRAIRYAHIDLAEVTNAGITVVHKELGENNQILVVVDFAIEVTSPTRIDLEAICQFFIDLKNEYNVQWGNITADRYQSAFLIQKLTKLKLSREAGHLSVVRTLEVYYQGAAQVNANLVRIGHAPRLHEQAKNVKEVGGKLMSRVRRDILDSFCGAIFNAIGDVKTAPEYTYEHEKSRIVSATAPQGGKKPQLEEI